jgi:hypothetical protein
LGKGRQGPARANEFAATTTRNPPSRIGGVAGCSRWRARGGIAVWLDAMPLAREERLKSRQRRHAVRLRGHGGGLAPDPSSILADFSGGSILTTGGRVHPASSDRNLRISSVDEIAGTYELPIGLPAPYWSRHCRFEATALHPSLTVLIGCNHLSAPSIAVGVPTLCRRMQPTGPLSAGIKALPSTRSHASNNRDVLAELP